MSSFSTTSTKRTVNDSLEPVPKLVKAIR